MKTEEALKSLAKLVIKQHKIIKKLAQEQTQELKPQEFAANPEVKAILTEMSEEVRSAVSHLQVTPGHVVQVKFVPGKGTDEAWAGVQTAVRNAQEKNRLPGTSYQIVEVL